jgi:glutamate-ammonia-ligase adenylyltransferase
MPEPEGISSEALVAQLGDAYAALDAPLRARHIELLNALRVPSNAAVDVHALDGERYAITICAADQVGALSVLAGLLTAHGLDIRSAWIFTVALPRAEAPRPRVTPGRPRSRIVAGDRRPDRALLDVFEARVAAGSGTPDWVAFEAEARALSALLAAGDLDAATEHVLEGVARHTGTRPEGGEPLYPVTIEVTPLPESTRLSILSADTPGFLFEFTAALATLRANIVGAEVRTSGGEAHDTFWLTDEGGRPISEPARLDELRVAAGLIKQFTHLLPGSPQPAQALRQFGSLVRSLALRPGGASALGDIASPEVLQRLADLMGVSRFLWEDFLRMQQDNLFPVLADTPGLTHRTPRSDLVEMMREAVAARPDDAPGDAERRLNAAKDREMFRIDLRHITRQVGLLAFARELADLAEATVIGAAALAEERLRAAHGAPRLDGGGECGWAICALGKLGGREIGYASDIELLFVYEGAGATDGARPISNHDYFEAFMRTVRDAIVARTEGIFEIDLRLRPHGNTGALATSLSGFAEYYSASGAAEQFERLALVRLRPFAGNEAVMERVRGLRDGWVYSGAALDVENILGLRHRQATELTRTGERNAKYSPGGVVDLEYFVQALQIEAGAHESRVRAPGTLEGAELLARYGYLPEMTAARLQEAYHFMRGLIDALRVVRGNAKDLAIPAVDSRAFAYLQRRLYYDTPEGLAHAIDVRMAFGHALWDTFEDLRAATRG